MPAKQIQIRGVPHWLYEFAATEGQNSRTGTVPLADSMAAAVPGVQSAAPMIGTRSLDEGGNVLFDQPHMARIAYVRELTDGNPNPGDNEESALAAAVAAADPAPSEDEIDAASEATLAKDQSTRRKAFDRMVAKTMRLLLQTGAAATPDDAKALGRAFMFPHRSARLEWVDTGYDTPILDAIAADTTPWLNNVHGNQSIKAYILSVFGG